MEILHFERQIGDPRRITEDEAVALFVKRGFSEASCRASLKRWGYMSSGRDGVGDVVVDGFEPKENLPSRYLSWKSEATAHA